jgi:hypothetical protein
MNTKRQSLKYHNNNEQYKNLSLNLMRRYSCHPDICVKNFVPVLRPQENKSKLIPSKLNLSSNNFSINEDIHPPSCPVSDEENEIESESDSSDFDSDSLESNFRENIQLGHLRRNLIGIRKDSSLLNKSMENKKIDIENVLYNKILKLYRKKESNGDSFEFDNKIYLGHKYSCNILPNICNKDNLINNFKRNRIRSFSILEILENNYKDN